MKLSTTVSSPRLPVQISLRDKIFVLGSCFADNMGAKLTDAGFHACVNPFGTLYNPESILESVRLLCGSGLFGPEDCVEMGAGAGMTCSFRHHTSFARPSAEEFLENANAKLSEARAMWSGCNKVIVTLGTARVWKLAGGRNAGMTVSNCLKRPGGEFSHEFMSLQQVEAAIRSLMAENPDKQFIFTVSPVRHMGEGARTNTISKALLNLGLENAIGSSDRAAIFPAYEIMLDELRDYRFYAEDLVHPSPLAVSIIWERFQEACIPEDETDTLRENEKAARRKAHRPLL